MSGIEIHNKPNFEYRYEIVIILFINSWELLLKAFIYKFHKKEHRIINKDGTSKTLDDCLNITLNKLGNNFRTAKENIEILSEYRNKIIHFYSRDLDILIYALLRKNIILYAQFLKTHLSIDLASSSNLILLPIGFRKSISPIDFVSNESVLNEASKEVRNFVYKIVQSSQKLSAAGIEDPIFIDLNISLTNVRNTKNADIIAGVNNTQGNPINFDVVKTSKKYVSSDDVNAQSIKITRDKSRSQGIIMHEELSDGIFEEINNVIDVNQLLSTESKKFILGEELYYRIYSERQHVSFNIELFESLTKVASTQFYCPYLYWITKLPPKIIAKILVESLQNYKYPNVSSLIQVMILLSDRGVNLVERLFTKKYGHIVQAPSYYYTIMELVGKRNKPNLLYKALRVTKGKILDLKGTRDNTTVQNISTHKDEFTGVLSNLCLSVFEGEKGNRGVCRTLDVLIYGHLLTKNAEEIMDEIDKYDL